MPSNLVANPSQPAQTARPLNITDQNQKIGVGSFITLTGRILFSAIFIVSGFMHFSQQEIGYAVRAGVPMAAFLVPAAGVLALLGGLSILLGYRAKIGAWVLVLFLVPVTLMMYNFWAAKDAATAQMQMAMFLKNMTMLGGALLISQFGAAALSLDARRNSAR